MRFTGAPDPASTMPLSKEPQNWETMMQRYEELQRRVTRFSVVEQELIDTRNRLDAELARFGRINAFSTRAIRATSNEAFASMVAEALLDVFEQEIGLFWEMDADGRLKPEPSALSGHPSGELPAQAFACWLEPLIAGLGDKECELSEAMLESQPAGLDFTYLLIGCCRDHEGSPKALLMTGITSRGADFHERLAAGHAHSFHVFTTQVAALYANRANAAIIQRQMKALHDSEERLALAFKGSEIGFWDWNVDSNETILSREWKAMLGYAEHEIRNHHEEWHSRVHPDDLARSDQMLADHIAGKTELYENIHRLRHKDGHYLWIMSRGCAVRDETGRCRRFVGTHTDLSKQKALEGRLREAREQAESASRAKSIFVASMSHEIRTPMNGVLGMLQLLRDSALTPEQATLVRTAEHSANALLDIIGDILDLSKVEAGKVELKHAPFDVIGLIENILGMMRVRAEAKDILLQLQTKGASPPHVIGDQGRLRQVLINLIGNAIKFTHRGGVTLQVETALIEAPAPLARITFRVSDTGIGISPKAVADLFEPFNQGESDQIGLAHAGTGLGLAISRSLVRLMGGEIEVKSRKGAGSEFRFTLCLPVTSAETLPPTSSTLPGMVPDVISARVLVVDDSATSSMVAKLMLESRGVQVEVASHGAEAVQKAAEASYDVIFMDCQMPGMDGYEATRQIRQMPGSRRHVPVIALTANAESGHIHECINSGMSDFLPKPVQKEQLIEKLVQHLETISLQ